MHKNMHYKNLIIDIFAVTFRKEGVDWNFHNLPNDLKKPVTFRKEGVDWNLESWCCVHSNYVTFRKEGVDWNWIGGAQLVKPIGHLPQGRCGLKLLYCYLCNIFHPSPSARKVWIEITESWDPANLSKVTFRKEGVDWNPAQCPLMVRIPVTFRKEGVDWNILASSLDLDIVRHLPQGRCGLK